MTNVRPNQLKKCIFTDVEELQAILSAIYEEDIDVHISLDGLWYESKSDLDIGNDDVCQVLSEYYDVQVTSIHIDDCDYVGVWIVYKELSTVERKALEYDGLYSYKFEN